MSWLQSLLPPKVVFHVWWEIMSHSLVGSMFHPSRDLPAARESSVDHFPTLALFAFLQAATQQAPSLFWDKDTFLPVHSHSPFVFFSLWEF